MPFAAKKHKHMKTANQNSKFPDWSDAIKEKIKKGLVRYWNNLDPEEQDRKLKPMLEGKQKKQKELLRR